MISQDEYKTVVNSEDTFEDLAGQLNDPFDGGPVVFAWTDGESTQLDILMVYKPLQYGYLQRGMKSSTDLFVAVSGYGMFSFELNGKWKSPGYVGEKLNLGSEPNDTNEALASLVNGVISCMTTSK